MKKGFTLVELLAVIVILAVILVIAVPQINNVIKETRKNSLGSTAKLIAAKAEEKEVENDALEKTETITCEDLVKLDDNYGNCTVSKNSTTGKWEVTIVGSGKFSGYTCTGTKDNMSCTEGSSNSSPSWVYAFPEYGLSSPSEGERDYRNIGKSIFLRYNANDLNEVYLCTTYNMVNDEPACFTNEVFIKKDEENSEWSKMQNLFGISNCAEMANSTHVHCSDSIDSIPFFCDSYNENLYCELEYSETYEQCYISSSSADCRVGNIGD